MNGLPCLVSTTRAFIPLILHSHTDRPRLRTPGHPSPRRNILFSCFWTSLSRKDDDNGTSKWVREWNQLRNTVYRFVFTNVSQADYSVSFRLLFSFYIPTLSSLFVNRVSIYTNWIESTGSKKKKLHYRLYAKENRRFSSDFLNVLGFSGLLMGLLILSYLYSVIPHPT